MQHRTVFEVMTHAVVAVAPDAPFKEVARLLSRHDVSAVPVVGDERRVVGVVTEYDLLRAVSELPDPEGRSGEGRPLSEERGTGSAETAAELMTAPATTARTGWNLVETARTMRRERVKRLPVVDETGRLVGIVSRSDLLRPFLRADTAILDEIEHDVLRDALGCPPDTVRASVTNGVVTLTGRVDDRADIPVLVRLCRSVDGVVALHESLRGTADASAGAEDRGGLASHVPDTARNAPGVRPADRGR